jgi:hypothetical protein
LACKGFEGRTRRCYEKEGGYGSGYIVKVKDKRKTIHGTAWYQLNHSSIVSGKVRFHVATWFGVCSYRKLKLMEGDRKHENKCPICGMELERIKYVGSGNPFAEWWLREFTDDFLGESGSPNWVVKSMCW